MYFIIIYDSEVYRNTDFFAYFIISISKDYTIKYPPLKQNNSTHIKVHQNFVKALDFRKESRRNLHLHCSRCWVLYGACIVNNESTSGPIYILITSAVQRAYFLASCIFHESKTALRYKKKTSASVHYSADMLFIGAVIFSLPAPVGA